MFYYLSFIYFSFSPIDAKLQSPISVYKTVENLMAIIYEITRVTLLKQKFWCDNNMSNRQYYLIAYTQIIQSKDNLILVSTWVL